MFNRPDRDNEKADGLVKYMNTLAIPLEIISHPTYKISATERNARHAPVRTFAEASWQSKATEMECNVIALGHHKDDAAETVLLNMLYGGRFKCYHPHLYMSRTRTRVIRPLLYIEERNILLEAELWLKLPIVSSCCPYGNKSKRMSVKDLLAKIESAAPDFKSNVIHALKNVDDNDVWKAVMPFNEENNKTNSDKNRPLH